MSDYSAWDVVQTARSLERPTAQYFIKNIFTDFIELHGDRAFGDDAAIISGIGRLNGIPVTIIGQEKGVSLSEKTKCNFGSAHPEGYRKTLRLMKQAEKFHRPVICIVDTQGAFCGVGAEERGVAEAIARNLFEMSRLKTPVISVLIGEGGSGGAIALAVADKVAMLENSVYSILSPEGFAAILWKDASRAPEAAELMRMPAPEVHAMGLVEDVIPEPAGGAKADDGGAFAQTVKEYLVSTLATLRNMPVDELVQARYDKLRAFGQNYVQTRKPANNEPLPHGEPAVSNSQAQRQDASQSGPPTAEKADGEPPAPNAKSAPAAESMEEECAAEEGQTPTLDAAAAQECLRESHAKDEKENEASEAAAGGHNATSTQIAPSAEQSEVPVAKPANGMELPAEQSATDKEELPAPDTPTLEKQTAATEADTKPPKASARSKKAGVASGAKTGKTAKTPATTKKSKKRTSKTIKNMQSSADEAKKAAE